MVRSSPTRDTGGARGPLRGSGNLVGLQQRLTARSAEHRALHRGGPYELAR
jgi:hypothetical protein